MRRLSLQEMIRCAFFVALIAVGSFIRIPVPVVPFTLQFLFTMLAGCMLGGRLGALSVGVYVLLGLMGAPVFAEGGGPWYVLKPSFGYLIGFIAAAYVTGRLVQRFKKQTLIKILGANFIGLFIVYSFGMVYYYVVCNYVINTPIALWPLVLYCFLLAVPGDVVLCILAAFIAKRCLRLEMKK